MRRGLATATALLAMAAFAGPAAVAQQSAPEGEDGAPRGGGRLVHELKGTVVSVDSAAGTIQVTLDGKKKRCRKPPRRQPQQQQGSESQQSSGNTVTASRRGPKKCGGGSAGQSKSVTVKTDADTRIRRAGSSASLSDLQAGDRILFVIVTEEPASRDEALEETADVISAKAPKAKPAEEAPSQG